MDDINAFWNCCIKKTPQNKSPLPPFLFNHKILNHMLALYAAQTNSQTII